MESISTAPNFWCSVLEGANPSAEGEDADEGGESGNKKVLDIEDQFRLNKIEGGMDKKTFTTDLKGAFNLPLQREST